MYLQTIDGQGVPQDYGKASQYFMASAHGGDLVAQFNLAQMHRLGLGVARSCNTAVVLYKRVRLMAVSLSCATP